MRRHGVRAAWIRVGEGGKRCVYVEIIFISRMYAYCYQNIIMHIFIYISPYLLCAAAYFIGMYVSVYSAHGSVSIVAGDAA